MNSAGRRCDYLLHLVSNSAAGLALTYHHHTPKALRLMHTPNSIKSLNFKRKQLSLHAVISINLSEPKLAADVRRMVAGVKFDSHNQLRQVWLVALFQVLNGIIAIRPQFVLAKGNGREGAWAGAMMHVWTAVFYRDEQSPCLYNYSIQIESKREGRQTTGLASLGQRGSKNMLWFRCCIYEGGDRTNMRFNLFHLSLNSTNPRKTHSILEYHSAVGECTNMYTNIIVLISYSTWWFF